MDVIYRRCGGLDVHRKTVVACIRIIDDCGKAHKEVRTFGTTTAELLSLSDWLKAADVTHAAMESTGVFWKPVWNILHGALEVLLVNAQHVKQVPGRKTDVKDCEWIAQLLQHGLLRASFVPSPAIRDLRELTRQRAKLIDQRATVTNRIHKVLEDANIKLGTVLSELMGVSGRAMLRAMIDGEQDPIRLSALAHRRLQRKLPELRLALEGRLTDNHRFLLRRLMTHVEFLESEIALFDQRIEELMRPFHSELNLLLTIPGIQLRSAQNLIAEIGPDMAQFPSAGHLASWAGMCPGNHQSAGKRKHAKTPKGNRWLRRTLGECAWGAGRSKNTYFSAQFRRLAPRRGAKRSIVAVGHSLLVTIYAVLKAQMPYRELGGNFFDRLQPQRTIRYHVKRLEQLGHKVILQPLPDVA